MIGQTIAHYKIESQLGVGGMGVVYRAIDSKLGRQVAIKVLPETFARDPDRVARFQREARLLASLNHPNIAAIHGLEESSSVRYLVLELVPGETLAELIKRGPLEVSEGVAICRQIAEALEAAHEKGITHRDLKPQNVKVTPEGKVKVLDFGLAKTFQAQSEDTDVSQSPTLTDDATRDGAILGTAAYMSPEQARGKPLDKRTDIWSFGCVLYEVLTQKRAFGGDSIPDSIAAVLTRDPEWAALPDATPESLRRLLRRCLQKDPQKRLRDIGDARIELEEMAAGTQQLERTRPAPSGMTRRTAMSALAGAAAGAAATGMFSIGRYRRDVPRNLTQFAIMAPENGVFVPSFN